MKKLITITVLAVLFLLPAYIAQAALSDSVKVKVKIAPSISVDITETELPIGDPVAGIPPGSVTPSATGVTVKNNGSGVKETYSLSLVNPTSPTNQVVWTAMQDPQDTVRDEKYVLNAAFDADGANITWDNTKHALSTSAVACSATKFAGDQNGVAVPYNETRTLWFQFKAPTATTATGTQEISVIVTAG